MNTKFIFGLLLIVSIIVNLIFLITYFSSDSQDIITPIEICNIDSDCSSGKVCKQEVLCDSDNCVSAKYCKAKVSVDMCGNGICEAGESCGSCSSDCGFCEIESICGNGICEGEENSLCVCPAVGECNCPSCPQDCAVGVEVVCGDGICGYDEGPVIPCDAKSDVDCPANPDYCPQDCGNSVCGNGICDPGEDGNNCAKDCIAGACVMYCTDGQIPNFETCKCEGGISCTSDSQCTGSGQWGILKCWNDCPQGPTSGIPGSLENPGTCVSCPPSVSLAKYKTDIESLNDDDKSNFYEELLSLNLVSFFYKPELGYGNSEYIGFLILIVY